MNADEETAFDHLISAIIQLAETIKTDENKYQIEQAIEDARRARILVFGDY